MRAASKANLVRPSSPGAPSAIPRPSGHDDGSNIRKQRQGIARGFGWMRRVGNKREGGVRKFQPSLSVISSHRRCSGLLQHTPRNPPWTRRIVFSFLTGIWPASQKSPLASFSPCLRNLPSPSRPPILDLRHHRCYPSKTHRRLPAWR